ncbi:MAG: hypothetical protein KTR21_08720 [Rhodobacteraceae bacterium]|nr:hypothetical protein [Paracoccaceae bacterium]
MEIVALLIQLASGAIGGNVAGAALQKQSLGTVWNSVIGILGGGLGGQILSMLGLGGLAAAGGGALDIGSIISSVVSGGVGGGALLAIIGVAQSAMGR